MRVATSVRNPLIWLSFFSFLLQRAWWNQSCARCRRTLWPCHARSVVRRVRRAFLQSRRMHSPSGILHRLGGVRWLPGEADRGSWRRSWRCSLRHMTAPHCEKSCRSLSWARRRGKCGRTWPHFVPSALRSPKGMAEERVGNNHEAGCGRFWRIVRCIGARRENKFKSQRLGIGRPIPAYSGPIPWPIPSTWSLIRKNLI